MSRGHAWTDRSLAFNRFELPLPQCISFFRVTKVFSLARSLARSFARVPPTTSYRAPPLGQPVEQHRVFAVGVRCPARCPAQAQAVARHPSYRPLAPHPSPPQTPSPAALARAAGQHAGRVSRRRNVRPSSSRNPRGPHRTARDGGQPKPPSAPPPTQPDVRAFPPTRPSGERGESSGIQVAGGSTQQQHNAPLRVSPKEKEAGSTRRVCVAGSVCVRRRRAGPVPASAEREDIGTV
eukprot:scaffold16077_cov35-Tisochrysis_lutea.AAC.2